MSVILGRTPPVRRELTEAERVERQELIKQLEQRRTQLDAQLQQSHGTSQSMRRNIFATIRAGHATQLQVLLEQKIYVPDERDYSGCTPLHIAAYEGRNDMVSILLEFGADPAAVDNLGRTPRDIALANRHVSVGRLLLTAQLKSSRDSLTDVLAAETQQPNAAGDVSPSATQQQQPQLSGGSDSENAGRAGGGGGHSPHVFGLSVGEEADWPLSMGSSRYCTIADTMSMVVCMVGLPGRGKSFISKRIARYLNWKGVPTKVFNAGNYRRQLLGAAETAGAEFFDPCNPEAVRQREEMARLACDDLKLFLNSHATAVGVLDATNTTLERRRSLIQTFSVGLKKKCRVIFIESVCTDENIILENILRAKCGNDDFKNVSDSATVIKEFRERIRQYEKVYETMTTDEPVSFIKIKNVKDQLFFHNIVGGVPTRLAYFLLNLHPVAYPIYLTLPGETVGVVERRFVGDQTLTPYGEQFSSRLLTFIEERCQDGSKITVLHATDPCAERTIEPLECLVPDKIELIPMRCLDDINAGTFSGLNHVEAKAQHPKMFDKLFPGWSAESSGENPPPQNYTVAFPRGESCRQVNVRLETALLQIMRLDGPVMVVAPLVPLQGVIAFLSDVLPELSPTISVPSHCIVEIGIKGGRIVHELNAQAHQKET